MLNDTPWSAAAISPTYLTMLVPALGLKWLRSCTVIKS